MLRIHMEAFLLLERGRERERDKRERERERERKRERERQRDRETERDRERVPDACFSNVIDVLQEMFGLLQEIDGESPETCSFFNTGYV